MICMISSLIFYRQDGIADSWTTIRVLSQFRTLKKIHRSTFMDPDEVLKELRELAEGMLNPPGAYPDMDDVEMFATQFLHLDNWLKRGGFPPSDWKEKRHD